MLEPHQSSDPPSTVAADPMPPTVPQHSPTLLDLFDMDDFDDEPTASPWWRRWWVAVVAGVVIVALVAGIVFAHAHQSTPAVTYQFARVSQGNLAITVSGTGPVQTALYNLNFAVSGRLAEIDVRVGQQVSAGQVLAKLDPTTLQDAVNQAQIQADLAYDQEQNAIYACQNEKSPPPTCIQQAEDQYAASQAQLKTAKDNLSNATLTATHAGVITAINGSVGGTPGSGSASGASGASGSSGFIQIADPSALQVVASVNEADIAGIATGQTVTFTVSAYSSRVFRGTVSAISPVGQTSSNVVTYPVTITVDNTALQGATLLNGMTANVTIVKQQRTNVLLLPVGAITFARAAVSTSTGGFLTRAQLTSAVAQGRQLLATLRQQNSQLSAENPTVAWVVERTNGQWVVKPVVLGLSNGSDYEVLSGLSAGESVVVGEQNGSITSSAVPTTGARGGGLGGGIFGGGRGGAGGNGGGGGGNGGGGSGGGRNG